VSNSKAIAFRRLRFMNLWFIAYSYNYEDSLFFADESLKWDAVVSRKGAKENKAQRSQKM
jgi:hypothetical protein